jgi:hypothetical protein
MNIISHSMHGITVAQRSEDGYVNATALSKACEKATGERREPSEWLSNSRTKESLKHLSEKTGIPVNRLVEKRRGVGGGTYIHPKLAIRFAIWLSDDFGYAVEEWVEEWAKGAYQNQHSTRQCPILEAPKPWTLTFERTFELELSRISGLHKRDIRNGLLYWEFIYNWMTAEDKAKHETANPVQPNGRRKYKIHQMLDDETKQRLAEHIQCVMNYMLIANSVPELRRMIQRRYGVDQGDLFDGWGIGK